MSKLSEFFSKIYQKTMNSEIKWETTSSDDTFQTSFRKYTVQIVQDYLDEHDNYHYKIRIINNSGIIIDTIDERQLDEYTNHAWEMLANIYKQARRIATGAEKAIEEILAELEKFDDAPF